MARRRSSDGLALAGTLYWLVRRRPDRARWIDCGRGGGGADDLTAQFAAFGLVPDAGDLPRPTGRPGVTWHAETVRTLVRDPGSSGAGWWA